MLYQWQVNRARHIARRTFIRRIARELVVSVLLGITAFEILLLLIMFQ